MAFFYVFDKGISKFDQNTAVQPHIFLQNSLIVVHYYGREYTIPNPHHSYQLREYFRQNIKYLGVPVGL